MFCQSLVEKREVGIEKIKNVAIFSHDGGKEQPVSVCMAAAADRRSSGIDRIGPSRNVSDSRV